MDPQWQRKFSIVWAAGVGLAVLMSIPHVARAFKTRRLFRGLVTGVIEDTKTRGYVPASGAAAEPTRSRRQLSGIWDTVWSATLWSLPGIELDVGQSELLLVSGAFGLVS